MKDCKNCNAYEQKRQFFLDVRELIKLLPDRFFVMNHVNRIQNELDKFTESEQQSLPFES